MTSRDDADDPGREGDGEGIASPGRRLRRPDSALAALVADAIDGGLSRARFVELESRLAADPQARRYYLDAMLIHARLATTFMAANPQSLIDLVASEAEPAATLPRGGSQPRTADNAGRDWFRSAAATLVVAAVLGSIVGGFGLGRWKAVTASLDVPDVSIAEVSQSRYAIDADTGETIASGRRVGRQRLKLDSGVVEIGIRNGVLILVEGPAEFEVLSETLCLLTKGTAVVRLPPGVGRYVLETPTARIDAHDGEFGVFVDEALTTDVQAYSGMVAVAGGTKTGGGQFPQPIAAGTAIRFTSPAEETPTPIAFDERRFVRRLPPQPGSERSLQGLEKPVEVLFGTPQLDTLVVTRAVRPVVVDGLLEEWSTEGVFRRGRQGGAEDREWIEGRMMYDDSNLYIAARVGDPAPMRNGVNPDLDPRLVWRGGALQVFLSLDRQMGWPADGAVAAYFQSRGLLAAVADVQKAENPKLLTVVMWHHAPSGRNRLSVIKRMTGEEMVMDPEGATGTFVRAADGKGYTLEYVIPWQSLGVEDDPPRSGDTLATAWELHLSDESGRIWRDQIVEIRNPEEPRGIFLFERATTWGRAEYR